MKFNTAKQPEFEKAFEYLSELGASHVLVDIKKVSPVRSLSQNAYLHVTFQIFGLEKGYEAQEAKVIYKREANPEIYVYEKNGTKFLRESSKLTTKQMSDSIDKWRKFAAEQGVDIPAPGDEEALTYWGNTIEKEGKYL